MAKASSFIRYVGSGCQKSQNQRLKMSIQNLTSKLRMSKSQNYNKAKKSGIQPEK